VSYQRLIAVDAVQNLSWREAVLGHVDRAIGGVEAGDATVTPDAGERLLDGLGAYGALRVESGCITGQPLPDRVTVGGWHGTLLG
jgi:hypothetical protein